MILYRHSKGSQPNPSLWLLINNLKTSQIGWNVSEILWYSHTNGYFLIISHNSLIALTLPPLPRHYPLKLNKYSSCLWVWLAFLDVEILGLLLSHSVIFLESSLTHPAIPERSSESILDLLMKFCLIAQAALPGLMHSYIHYMVSDSWNQLLTKNKYCLTAVRKVQIL